MLVIGLILSLAGILLLLGEIRDSAACSQSVTARVIRMEKDAQSYWRGTFRYYPVFSYAVNGETYIRKAKASPTRNKNKYRIGEELAIRYSPEHPEHFRTGARVSAYLISMVLLAIGITLIVCCFL